MGEITIVPASNSETVVTVGGDTIRIAPCPGGPGAGGPVPAPTGGGQGAGGAGGPAGRRRRSSSSTRLSCRSSPRLSPIGRAAAGA